MLRRRRLTHRALPLSAIAAVAFIAGVIAGAGNGGTREVAQQFVDAWARQDFAAMHGLLTASAAAAHTPDRLATAYREAQETATVAAVAAGRAGEPRPFAGRELVGVPLQLRTRALGAVRAELELPIEGGRIAWAPHLVYPGLRPREQLAWRPRAPRRAAILAADGSALAIGPAGGRTSEHGDLAGDLIGSTGEPSPVDAAQLREAGFPDRQPVGRSGLELAFDERLAGTAGGRLLAISGRSGASRTLARSRPQRGEPVRTTLEPRVQRTAEAILAERNGGVAVIDTRDGAVLALAGLGVSALQPPGSTFKIVTAIAALETGATTPSKFYEPVDYVIAGGRQIENAHDETCGGTFVQAFARSCNTVFAPLGHEVGAKALIETAKRFGFNSRPALYNDQAAEVLRPRLSSIPAELTDRELGVTAIGQGRLLATPLQLASIAQTIAAGGVRHPTPLVRDSELGPDAEPVRVTSRRYARQVQQMMLETVLNGTGYQGKVPGAQVAGKTGTAELGVFKKPEPGEQAPAEGEEDEREQEVTAWFTAFAPAGAPRVALAVMIIRAEGDGGEVAAPLSRPVMSAALLVTK